MSKETLPPSVFVLLHDAIVDEHAKRCEEKGVEVPSTTTALYGHGQDADEKNSITAMMLETEAVKNYIEKNGKKRSINGKALYDRRLNAKKGNAITLPRLYAAIYPLFLGYDNLEAFLQANTTPGAVVYYTGYYFSKQSEQVKIFACQLTSNREAYDVSLKGFHEGALKDPFSGTGKIGKRNLFINASNEDGIGMTVIVPVDSTDFINKQTYLHGVLTTITSDDFPLSTRILLVKQTGLKKQELRKEKLSISRYLALHRQILRAPRENIGKLEDLAIRGEIVDSLVAMIGTYWIWRYSNGNIVQTKMTIKDDFSVLIKQPMYNAPYSEQIGVVNISRAFNHCLCITSLAMRGPHAYQVLSFCIVEILQTQTNFGFLNGAFCNVGTVGTDNQPIFGDNMIVYKEKPDAPLALLVPNVIPEGEFAEYVESYDYLELLIVRGKLKVVRERTKGGNV